MYETEMKNEEQCSTIKKSIEKVVDKKIKETEENQLVIDRE